MPQGKPVSEDIQWIIIHLGANLSPKDVSMYTNVSEHKVWATLANNKKTGKVIIPKCEKHSLYRKLQEEDLQIFYFYFYFTACFILPTVSSISTKF